MARKTRTYWEQFWLTNCAYNPTHKGSWHEVSRCRLRRLAQELGLQAGTYEIRSNQGGIAVSGEVTLHSEELYVQVSQGGMGPSRAILIRTCNGRKDYTGGPNYFTHILDLENISALAGFCTAVMGLERKAA